MMGEVVRKGAKSFYSWLVLQCLSQLTSLVWMALLGFSAFFVSLLSWGSWMNAFKGPEALSLLQISVPAQTFHIFQFWRIENNLRKSCWDPPNHKAAPVQPTSLNVCISHGNFQHLLI